MDTYDFDDYENDELGDEQNNFAYTSSFRDSTLFLVDCTESMFVKYEEEEYTLFEKSMRAIHNFYRAKIYGSHQDYLGVVFFGTNKHADDTGDFKHMTLIQDLDQPSAASIKEIEKFSNNLDVHKFKKDYGHNESFSLNQLQLIPGKHFNFLRTKKLDTKRIMIFTRRDRPHKDNPTYERLALNKSKDLNDNGIEIGVFPLVLKGEKFDMKFYGDIMMLSDEEIELLPDPAETFEEIESCLRSKDHKRRPYTHLKLSLSDNFNIACSVYNLVRECPKPTKLKLDKRTNQETKTVTRRYVEETGEILFASDTKLAVDVCGKRIAFEQDEVKAIKRFGSAGLKLLGFKSLDSIKPYMFIKPGHFLYPDEKVIEGSTTLFKTLLDKCLEKKRFILCELITRVNSPPKLVALCPQEEELDSHRFQTCPPGFHVIYLPFADDFREIDRKIDAEKSQEGINIFGKCIKKMQFTFNSEDIKNPAIQKLWSEIEAIALERDETEEILDLTLPDTERIESRAGGFLKEISEMYSLDELKTASKRKAETNADSSKKPKIADNADIESAAKSGTLEKLTVPQLKEYIKAKSLKATGAKKDDLIKAIKKFLKIEN